MMNKQQIKDMEECELMGESGQDKDCSECSCSVCIAQQPNSLTANEYQKAALRTAHKLSSNDLILNGALGLCGESGEVADMVKKHLFQGHELNHDKIIKELGDVCWYIAIASKGLGVDLETVMIKNIKKLEDRYPNGFEAKRSINRTSKVSDTF